MLQQIDFSKSEQFYEQGSHRLMIFADTSKPGGAKLIYGDTIPDGIKNPNHPDRSKRLAIFIRNDVYFYVFYLNIVIRNSMTQQNQNN